MGTENIEKNTFINESPSQSQQQSEEVSTIIPVTIDEDNVIDGARRILQFIRPEWTSNNIKFKVHLLCHLFITISFICGYITSKKIKYKDQVMPSKSFTYLLMCIKYFKFLIYYFYVLVLFFYH